MNTFTIFLILIMIVCMLLMLVVMVQNPKGGGLSSSFGGGGNQVVGGVKKTGDFLDKSTWTLAVLLIVLILLSNVSLKGNFGQADSKVLEGGDSSAPVPETLPEEITEEVPSTSKATPADTIN